MKDELMMGMFTLMMGVFLIMIGLLVGDGDKQWAAIILGAILSIFGLGLAAIHSYSTAKPKLSSVKTSRSKSRKSKKSPADGKVTIDPFTKEPL